jgi:hypothetical protein
MSFSAFAKNQDSTKLAKNSLYVQAGVLSWGQVGLSYERYVFSTKSKNLSFFARANAGAWGSFGGEGSYITASLQGLLGKNKSHLEFGGGLVAVTDGQLFFSSENYNVTTQILPAASVGYRYQKPEGGFVFRTGIGILDGVYLSFGYAF